MSNTFKIGKRKGSKKVHAVTFTIEGFDGEFTFPSLNSVPFGVQSRLSKGDGDALLNWLPEGDLRDFVYDLDDDSGELGAFMKAWSEASEVDSGKSGPASA